MSAQLLAFPTIDADTAFRVQQNIKQREWRNPDLARDPQHLRELTRATEAFAVALSRDNTRPCDSEGNAA